MVDVAYDVASNTVFMGFASHLGQGARPEKVHSLATQSHVNRCIPLLAAYGECKLQYIRKKINLVQRFLYKYHP
jgi:hypothetical protein